LKAVCGWSFFRQRAQKQERIFVRPDEKTLVKRPRRRQIRQEYKSF
jgi:hypothetical protein